MITIDVEGVGGNNLWNKIISCRYFAQKDTTFTEEFLSWCVDQDMRIIVEAVVNSSSWAEESSILRTTPDKAVTSWDVMWYKTFLIFESEDDLMLFKLTWV